MLCKTGAIERHENCREEVEPFSRWIHAGEGRRLVLPRFASWRGQLMVFSRVSPSARTQRQGVL